MRSKLLALSYSSHLGDLLYFLLFVYTIFWRIKIFVTYYRSAVTDRASFG